MSGRIPVAIVGVVIGDSDDWDELDTLALMFYSFNPDRATNMVAGDLYVNFESGIYEVYAGDRIIQTGQIIDVLKEAT